ncbi:MAG: bifunctional diguanylate cyclase/phosphodiesterase [Desulfonauticus sp.]|nr:bifunctional diguanylate cyclase/phosphodiesterase [Desulfonauticus sp.]
MMEMLTSFLDREIRKKIEGLITDKEYQSIVINVCCEALKRYILSSSQENSHILLDENQKVIGFDSLFLKTFNFREHEILNKKINTIFEDIYEIFIKSFLEDIKKQKYVYHPNITIEINNRKQIFNLIGEELIINKKKYILITLSKKELVDIDLELTILEKKIADICLRIKEFNSLIEEIFKTLTETSLFKSIWIGKVDKKTQTVKEIIASKEKIIEDFLEKEREDIINKLNQKKDLLIYKKDKFKIIVFPIFNTWDDYNEIDFIAYIILTILEKDISLNKNEIYRLKEIIYKINVAINDIFTKQLTTETINKDPLTNLLTRIAFLEKVKKLIDDKIPFCLILIDIDRLRKVNDVLGFWAGDNILRRVSDYIKTLDTDLKSRFGGDEFGIIVKGNKKRAYKVLNDLIKFNEEFIKVNGAEIFMPISISASFYPDDAQDLDNLIIITENALKSAKNKGGKRLEYANPNITILPKNYLSLEKELKEAIENEEYLLMYQPIIDLKEKKLWGVEALIRWNSRKRGLISPSVFIPILEDSGLIIEVGDWLIKEVCKIAKEFEEFNLHVSFSMNISVKQMLYKNIAKEIIKRAKEFQIKTKLLIVEITETLLMENIETLIEQLNELVEADIRIEIDDFGTGYSSLSYLKDLPIYAIKIDRSFTKNILKSKEEYSLVNAIAAMAKALNKQSIAEGVENKELLKKIIEMDINKAQGYYFAKPMLGKELKSYIESFNFENYI